MTQKKWKVAVVGCGDFGTGQYIPFSASEANAEVVAVVDIIEERAIAAAEKFGVPNYYTSIQECLEKCDVDIVFDAASIQAHHEINMHVLSKGKHLISQKPAAPDVAHMTEQIELAKKMGVKYACAPIHNMRYDLNVAKQLMADGAIGNPYYVKCNSSHGGPEYFQYRAADPSWFYDPGAGALVDMGVHAIQQVTYLMGPVKRVSCTSTITTPVREVRSGAYDGKLIQADKMPDLYLINLEFASGAVGFIDCGFSQKASKGPGLQVYGDKGTLAFEENSMANQPPEVYIDAPERGLRGWMKPMGWVKQPERLQTQCCILRDLIRAIENDTRPVLHAEHARHIIEIMSAIEVAAKEQRPVELETTF